MWNWGWNLEGDSSKPLVRLLRLWFLYFNYDGLILDDDVQLKYNYVNRIGKWWYDEHYYMLRVC